MTQLTRNTTADWSDPRAWAGRLSDYIQLTKPRITLMVVVTAYVGLAVAAGLGHGPAPWPVIAAALVGTALSCMGAGVLNQVYERDTDARMKRTASRPLPAGRIALPTAALYGALLCLAGVAVLAVWTSPTAALLSSVTIAAYVLIYTPMKRWTPLATVVGAVPGAMPPLIGYTAVAGQLDLPALSLFGILFVWQLPHFLAIAWLYREDYARARLPMLPVVDPEGGSTFRQTVLGCLVLVPMGLAPAWLGVGGRFYVLGSLLAGLLMLAFALALLRRPDASRARRAFLVSLIYLPVVFGLLLVDGP
jgi:protoheme IX farnesyltransferase